MPQLGVNIDHVATLRQARRIGVPDVLEAARIAERAGCDSIVCHLREDRRHMQDADVEQLQVAVRTHLNLEMSIAPEIVQRALSVRPRQVTLVPERRQELTTEGGLDVLRHGARVADVARQLTAAGIAVSVFIDPDARQVAAVPSLGIPIIELHTGRYAEAPAGRARDQRLEELSSTVAQARGLGLRVNAGHGLDYDNVAAVAGLPEIEELNIGFSIIARALIVGLEAAVREMATLVHAGATDGARLRR